MNPKTIRFSVSKLDNWRLYLEGANFLPEDFHQFVQSQWLKKAPTSDSAKFGNAFHDWIEKGGPDGDHFYMNNPKTDSNNNPIPGTGEEIYIHSVELRDVRKFVQTTAPYRKVEVELPGWEINLGSYRFLITGRIDGDLGPAIEDHKLKTSYPKNIFDTYKDSMQWRYYLAMTGKTYFFYNIFYRRPNQHDYISGPEGGSVLIETPKIELVDQIKLTTYNGIVEECRAFAFDLFSLLIRTGYAERIYQYQNRWPAKIKTEPKEVQTIEIPDLDLSPEATRLVEAYFLAGETSDPPEGGLPVLTKETEGSPSLEEIRKDYQELDDLIGGKIGNFVAKHGEGGEKVLVEAVKEVEGEEGRFVVNFVGEEFGLYCETIENVVSMGTVYTVVFSGNPQGTLTVDSAYRPESILTAPSEVLEEPAQDEETDLGIVKKELLRYKDRPGLISLDGGKSYGELIAANKVKDRIRVKVAFGNAETAQTEYIVSMFADGDFRTSSGAVVNVLPF